jgi:hypothetical protein
MAIQILRKKFTVEQYHQMIEPGILSDRSMIKTAELSLVRRGQ